MKSLDLFAHRTHPLRKWMVANGHTIHTLAALLGVHPKYVSAIICWRRRPGGITLVKLIEITGLPRLKLRGRPGDLRLLPQELARRAAP